MSRKLSASEERLQQIQLVLDKWTAFVRELPMPPDLAPAFMTGRMELIRLAKPRALTVEECETLYRFVGGVLETNAALREHTYLLADIARDTYLNVRGLIRKIERLSAYANYRMPDDDGDDE